MICACVIIVLNILHAIIKLATCLFVCDFLFSFIGNNARVEFMGSIVVLLYCIVLISASFQLYFSLAIRLFMCSEVDTTQVDEVTEEH